LHAKFSLVVHDECSSFGFVFNLDHTVNVFIDLDKVIENKFQKWVHTLKMDIGGEFTNNELQTYCWDRGITSATSVTYNPELNGCSERPNRTHIEGARTMLKDLDLGKDLWGKALSTHIYIHNCFPSNTLPGNITPYEKVFGHAPSICHLHVFRLKCFIKVPDETWSKLDDKAKECQLIGYKGDSIYMVVDMSQKKL